MHLPRSVRLRSDHPALTSCDREPIHVPGAIQPYGQMLIARAQDLQIVGTAGTATDWLAAAMGGAMPEVTGLPASGFETLRNGLNVLGDAEVNGARHDAVAFRSGDHVVLELTPRIDGPTLDATFLADLEALGAGFERSTSLSELFTKAAHVFRDLTGYDHVMVYRFIEGENGVVVGESRAPDTPSYMNHHFPAGDIPRQARALYVRNRVRVIADVAYDPAAISGDPALRDLDLSDSTLRAVSPVHVQYLRNMGVAASASMSIIKDGMLWGLVACHNHAPRVLSLTTRLACQAMAASLARQIKAREETELYRERIRLRTQEDVVLSQLGSDSTLTQFFAASGKQIAALLQADGFAAMQGDDLFTVGSCPDPIDMRSIADHVRLPAAVRPFVTSNLSADWAEAKAYKALASGLMAVTMSTEVPTILMWFRAEETQMVTWAGNPHKDVPLDPNAVLSPRTSFAAWSEEVSGRARAWTHGEEESAARLVRLMLDARNNRRLRELNRELTTTLKENESLIQQKDFLLREVNHRVQNSLSLVAAFLRMQGREASGEVKAQLAEAENRLKAVSLVHRRLHQHDSGEILDLARYLDELCTELRDTIDPAWTKCIETSFVPILIGTDRAISIGLIVNELVINATKYAYDGQAGPIGILLEQHRDSFRVIVSDSGVGHGGAVKGTGFGMRMLGALVDRLGGHLDIEDNMPGTRVIVTGPIR
nr:histidine kinase dimerization/phosphoacceptor domain -containing protein [Falsirhodobacter halotolerans]